MPGVSDANSPESEAPSSREKAESSKLWLPSYLDPTERGLLCSEDIISNEKELRFGQLDDALNELRRARRIRRGLITFHKVQLSGEGQKTQTKSRAVMQTVQERIGRSVQRYRTARNVLLQLDATKSWQDLYRPLNDRDNRGPGKEPEEELASDGKHIPSWIWLSNSGATAGDSGQSHISSDEVNEDMRVEWAQCVARADRWEEEVTLLQEEMRRVVFFLEWRSKDWTTRVDARAGDVTPEVSLGLSAYARKQASIFLSLAVKFCQHWRLKLISLSLSHDWATGFLEARGITPDEPKKQKKKGPGQSESNLSKSPTTPPSAESVPAKTTTAPPAPTNIEANVNSNSGNHEDNDHDNNCDDGDNIHNDLDGDDRDDFDSGDDSDSDSGSDFGDEYVDYSELDESDGEESSGEESSGEESGGED